MIKRLKAIIGAGLNAFGPQTHKPHRHNVFGRLLTLANDKWKGKPEERRDYMNSWKTTLAGILTAIGAALSQSDNPTLKLIGQILIVVGPIILGAVAKDHNVTGGTKKI